jgi:molybdopterin-binding protein
MRTRTMLLVSVVAILNGGCSSTSSQVDVSTQDDVVAVTTTTAQKSIQIPTAAELAALIPSPEVMQQESANFGGYYSTLEDVALDDQSDVSEWATGVQVGLERSLKFFSLNEDDPMQLHEAFATIRILIFDTPQNAVRSTGMYVGRLYNEKAQIEFRDRGDTRIASIRYSVPSDKLNWRSEGLRQRGRVLVWMQYRDNTTLHWAGVAHGIAEQYLDALVRKFPGLSAKIAQ